jgi:hypothetical protein
VTFALVQALLASPALAERTDLEKFQKALDKHAYLGNLFDGQPKKPLCRCLEGILTPAPAAGWVTQDMIPSDPTRISLRCAIPTFGSSGELAGINYCSEWEPL